MFGDALSSQLLPSRYQRTSHHGSGGSAYGLLDSCSEMPMLRLPGSAESSVPCRSMRSNGHCSGVCSTPYHSDTANRCKGYRVLRTRAIYRFERPWWVMAVMDCSSVERVMLSGCFKSCRRQSGLGKRRCCQILVGCREFEVK